MKIIESNVGILRQEPGIEGLYKHIEKVARVAYKTENWIKEDSYVKFCNMLKERGHWNCFEHGTVYLKIPRFQNHVESVLLKNDPQTKYTMDSDYYYFTTNLRVIMKLINNKIYPNSNSEDLVNYILNNFWCEPNEKFKRRITSHWICSRAVSHELVRHRAFCYLQTSQRYVAYDKDKNGGEITFILPQWIYDVRDEAAKYCDPITGKSREYLFSESGIKLWNSLASIDRTVASREGFWKICEEEYLWERNTEESTSLKPEDARGVLCNDVMTELYMTGFEEDYTAEPKDDEKEKYGFFTLRTDNSAHPDIRVLAIKLKTLFNENN